MNRKKLLIVLAIFVVIAIPFSVFAATSNTPAAKTVRGFFGIDTSKLNVQQKADIKDYSTKMANLQKEFIKKMVANGSMTNEQGDAAIKKIDDQLNKGVENGLTFGMRKGGMGKGQSFGKNALDTSKLTSAQLTDLTAIYKKMVEQQKATISKMVSNGLLTAEQGEKQTKAVDDRLAKIGTDGSFIGNAGLEGFMGFGPIKMNTSKLTDQQKTDLADASKKMTDLQKELINLLVTDNVLTKTQGDNMLKKIDTMQSAAIAGGYSMDFGMKKGKFNGRGNSRVPNTDSFSAPNTKKYF